MRLCRVCPAQMILYWICILFSHSQCHFSLIYCSYHQTAYIARSGYVKHHIAKIMTKLGSKVGVPSSNFSVASCQLPVARFLQNTHAFITTHKELRGDHQQRFSVWMSCKFHCSCFLLFSCLGFQATTLQTVQKCCGWTAWHWPNKRARWPESSINVWVWHNGLYLNSYLFSH